MTTMKWRPIEEAPRDGTRVDLWLVDSRNGGHRVTDAYWETEGHIRTWVGDSWGVVRQPCWYAPGFDYDGADGCCETRKVFCDHPRRMEWVFDLPTHYMPLPEPPGGDDV